MQWDVNAIIAGYAQGYFLMADTDQGQLDWYSSRERTIMPLDQRFHYPRSLQRVLNQDRFRVAINQDFSGVVKGCANRDSTWISNDLQQIYLALHQAGWAHSFETWQGDQLAGGVLGIAIAGLFIGESMFYHVPEASKVALVKLVEYLRSRQFSLFDVQINNPHLERFGACAIADSEYQTLLDQALRQNCGLN
ncbi:MAG: leucyl/phenylalanyl-tRNA--protein transferase [Aphanocapsa sp. GSE-SYN-MK-11-07L]|jgi:leucyl/phenylalanyl-tRNA--protein transferase|nr:leucyl/phenylalanyl-tRNA--protein transferase [Aphanocapsa sp. GSE-SYN-MK-11-07L]